MCAKPARQRYALLLAYDGGAYSGWQMQPGKTTVQETIGEALLAAGLPPTVNGASRTDRGVHARAMVATTSSRMPTDPLVVRALLRKHLPREIRLRAVAKVPHEFHAQFNSRGKQYRYHLWLRDHQGPQPRLAWALPDEERTAYLQPRFDQRRFQQALEAMKGRRTFAGAMAESAKQGVTHLYESRILRQVDSVHGRRLTLSFQADRFGKYMIRTLVGIAVRCAWGELDVGTLAARLDAEEPLTQLLAPPQGLALWKVLYQPDPFPWLR